jgi:hypothetical protein
MVNLLPAASFSAAAAICLAASSVSAFLSASWISMADIHHFRLKSNAKKTVGYWLRFPSCPV